MAMRVLVDTNVILDYLLKREPYDEYAEKILMTCQQKKISGCIAAHSITNILYSYADISALKNEGKY